MAGLSNAFSTAILNAIKGSAMTVPDPLYVALYTTNPSDNAGTGAVECTGTGYAREAIAASGWSAVGAGSSTNKKISNAGTVDFGTAGAGWGTITGFGLYDASSNGTLYGWAALGSNKTINSGDTVDFAAGALVVGA
jgi:hypothetical protein